MSFIGSLFGTEKAVNNIVDKDNGLITQVGGWIGNFSYTDEEKAKMGLSIQKFGLERLKALEPFKVVQRILAFGITFNWMIISLNCVAAIWYDALHPGYTTPEGVVMHGTNVADTMLKFAMSDFIFWPVVSVLSLYFTGGVVESVKKRFSPQTS